MSGNVWCFIKIFRLTFKILTFGPPKLKPRIPNIAWANKILTSFSCWGEKTIKNWFLGPVWFWGFLNLSHIFEFWPFFQSNLGTCFGNVPKGQKSCQKWPIWIFFVVKNQKYDHSYPVWYLDFSFGTKHCQLRLVGDLQNAAIKAMQNYYNYTISLTYQHGSIVSFFCWNHPWLLAGNTWTP